MLRTLWVALFASVGLFVFAAALSKVEGEPTPLPLPVVIIVAAALFVSSFVVPPMLEKKALAGATFAVNEEAGETEGGFRSSPEKARVLSDSGAAMTTFLRIHQSSMIIGLALAEAVSMCGLAVAISSHVWWQILPFAIATSVSMMLKLPSEAKLIAALEHVSGAKYRSAR